MSTSKRRGNREGSNPVQRKDGRWQVHIRYTDDNGVGKRTTVYGKTATEARDKADEVRDRLRAHLPAKDRKVTVAAFTNGLDRLDARGLGSQGDDEGDVCGGREEAHRRRDDRDDVAGQAQAVPRRSVEGGAPEARAVGVDGPVGVHDPPGGPGHGGPRRRAREESCGGRSSAEGDPEGSRAPDDGPGPDAAGEGRGRAGTRCCSSCW